MLMYITIENKSRSQTKEGYISHIYCVDDFCFSLDVETIRIEEHM